MSDVDFGSNGRAITQTELRAFVPADLVAKLAGVQLAQACKIIAALDALAAVSHQDCLISARNLPTTPPDGERRRMTDDAYQDLLEMEAEHEGLCERLSSLAWVNENIKRALGKR